MLDNRIISTGYNGTPENMVNCLDGGCYRCANRDKSYKSGEAYDLCICVHAEQNAILAAARFGISTAGSTMYTTMRPCFGCAKEMLQAQVRECVLPARVESQREGRCAEDGGADSRVREADDPVSGRRAPPGSPRSRCELGCLEKTPATLSLDRHGTVDI